LLSQKYGRDNFWQVDPREEVKACRKYFSFLIAEYGFALNQVTVNYDYYDGYEQVIFEFLKPDAKVTVHYENLFTRDFSYDVSVEVERAGGESKEFATWSTLVSESDRREMNEQANPKRRALIICSKFEKLASYIQANAARYLGAKYKGPKPGCRKAGDIGDERRKTDGKR